jgi:molybdopterin biosynthesis enzyme
MQGAKEPAMKEEWALLARSVKASIERESYLPAQLKSNEEGSLLAEPLKWGGSSDFIAFARATALIIVPKGGRTLDKHSHVKIVRLPG